MYYLRRFFLSPMRDDESPNEFVGRVLRGLPSRAEVVRMREAARDFIEACDEELARRGFSGEEGV